MKKLRVIVLFVTLLIVFSVTSSSSAFEVHSSDSLSGSNLRQGVSEELNYTLISQVLKSASVITESQAFETTLITYSTNSLSQYLPDDAQVREICFIKHSNINAYMIDFIRVNGNRTILEYNSNGSSSVSEYDRQSGDIIVEDNNKQQQIYTKEQLAGTRQEMPPELQKEINDYLNNGQIDKIRQIPGIIVIEDGDSVSVEMERGWYVV